MARWFSQAFVIFSRYLELKKFYVGKITVKGDASEWTFFKITYLYV